LVCEGVPQEVFFALALQGGFPQGTVFHDAFRAEGPQANSGTEAPAPCD
jgi:putative acetyltransferase